MNMPEILSNPVTNVLVLFLIQIVLLYLSRQSMLLTILGQCVMLCLTVYVSHVYLNFSNFWGAVLLGTVFSVGSFIIGSLLLLAFNVQFKVSGIRPTDAPSTERKKFK